MSRFHDKLHPPLPSVLVQRSLPQPLLFAETETHAIEEHGEETEMLISPLSLYHKRVHYTILEYRPLLDSAKFVVSSVAT